MRIIRKTKTTYRLNNDLNKEYKKNFLTKMRPFFFDKKT